MTSLPIIQFDRSRTEGFQRCPRFRWWGWEYEGIGLEREALAVPLLTGGQVHKGLEVLLQQHVAGFHVRFPNAPQTTLELAVQTALSEYDKQVAERGIDEPGVVGESNRAMIEALIRGYAMVMLPSLLERYEVLGVECEEEAWWYKDYEWRLNRNRPRLRADLQPTDAPQVRLLARLDGLLKRKADSATFVLSFKTCSAADQWWTESFIYDNQTQSECIAAEARLGHPVDGVIVQGLVKGARKVRWNDEWHNSSPLIWGWWNEEKDEWAIQYEWVDAAGLNRRLGKGYRREPVWRSYPGGVTAWLAKIADECPDVLAASFVELSPILRSDWERAQWQRQTLYQEVKIAESAQKVNSEQDTLQKQYLLDTLFPKHSAGGACIRPSRCPYHSLCWSASGQSPLESGYRYRSPNHEKEREHNVHLQERV